MVGINKNYAKLSGGYLFSEIDKRTKDFQTRNPDVKVMKLGIGNTTEPLTPTVVDGLRGGSEKLAHIDTYSGYGDEQGNPRLRLSIAARHYGKLGIGITPGEIFVSDGAKCDAGNIQSIFGDGLVAVQDPAYPVYVDTNVIAGRGGEFWRERNKQWGIHYMPCTEENGFFPSVPTIKELLVAFCADLIYLCSPNNPTGAVATMDQLREFVDYAREHKAVLIFDAAYSAFIQDPIFPQSIYEVPGAQECAIEIQSFSKSHGFTGVRLGWAVVPHDLVVERTTRGEVNNLWNRRQGTFFNGASNIAQEGGLAALTEQGMAESQELIDFYMENARIIREGVQNVGLKAFGGINAPYIWLKTPNEMSSWEFFDKLLEEAHVVGTPSVGFGPSGEGFFRLSAFGHREDVEEAVGSIENCLRL